MVAGAPLPLPPWLMPHRGAAKPKPKPKPALAPVAAANGGAVLAGLPVANGSMFLPGVPPSAAEGALELLPHLIPPPARDPAPPGPEPLGASLPARDGGALLRACPPSARHPNDAAHAPPRASADSALLEAAPTCAPVAPTQCAWNDSAPWVPVPVDMSAVSDETRHRASAQTSHDGASVAGDACSPLGSALQQPADDRIIGTPILPGSGSGSGSGLGSGQRTDVSYAGTVALASPGRAGLAWVQLLSEHAACSGRLVQLTIPQCFPTWTPGVMRQQLPQAPVAPAREPRGGASRHPPPPASPRASPPPLRWEHRAPRSAIDRKPRRLRWRRGRVRPLPPSVEDRLAAEVKLETGRLLLEERVMLDSAEARGFLWVKVRGFSWLPVSPPPPLPGSSSLPADTTHPLGTCTSR